MALWEKAPSCDPVIPAYSWTESIVNILSQQTFINTFKISVELIH